MHHIEGASKQPNDQAHQPGHVPGSNAIQTARPGHVQRRVRPAWCPVSRRQCSVRPQPRTDRIGDCRVSGETVRQAALSRDRCRCQLGERPCVVGNAALRRHLHDACWVAAAQVLALFRDPATAHGMPGLMAERCSVCEPVCQLSVAPGLTPAEDSHRRVP